MCEKEKQFLEDIESIGPILQYYESVKKAKEFIVGLKEEPQTLDK